jgi:hypothetical protein
VQLESKLPPSIQRTIENVVRVGGGMEALARKLIY